MIPFKISQKIQRQQFYPGFLGVFVNPFYHMRRQLWLNIADLAPRIAGKTLDVGCGSKPYEELFSKSTQYTGIDYDSAENRAHTKADVFYDGENFPLLDESFDSALATEVLEHVFNPDKFLAEIQRVLRKGGMLLLTAPFVWDEHSQPYDYARYSSFGVAYLVKKHGFEIVEQRKTAPDVRALFQLLNCYFYKIIPFKNYRLRMCCYFIFTAPTTIMGLVVSKILPKNQDLYLSNILLLKKL
jgi:SAM-dependent methyltransferase